MQKSKFLLLYSLVLIAGLMLPLFAHVSSFIYYFAFTVLQYVAWATAWNIQAGYSGYMNFGIPAFWGLSAYVSGFLYVEYGLGLPVGLLVGSLSAAALGGIIGVATLRLRGIYYSIATLAVNFVLLVLVINSPAFGGSAGMFIVLGQSPFYADYVTYVFVVMFGIAWVSLLISWYFKNSMVGRGLTVIRDDEVAAESVGVPTLRLKILVGVVSAFLIGSAGAPYPYYIQFMEPNSVFSLDTAFNTLAMSLIGGIGTLTGPLVGALLISTIQQVIIFTVSRTLNLLVLSITLLLFIMVAPNGIIGFIERFRRRTK